MFHFLLFSVICSQSFALGTTHTPSNAISTNEIPIDDNDTKFKLIMINDPKYQASELDILNVLSSLNLTEKNVIDLQMAGNSENEAMLNTRTGVFLFTRYCGPGSRLWNKIFKQDQRTYVDIDYCCKMHDECPNYVEKLEDYNQYPGLEFRPQFFSRLQCKCDADFYKCLQNINAPYAQSVGVGYGIFQRFCFEHEHPALECAHYYSGFGLKRCITYRLNTNLPKVWQWFDVLPSFLNITEFPQFIRHN